MLEEIRISSLGVIESSTLELGPGLTVITGETGAGKTMVVTALGPAAGRPRGHRRRAHRRPRRPGRGCGRRRHAAGVRGRGRGRRRDRGGRPASSWPATSRPRAVRAPSSAGPRCRCRRSPPWPSPWSPCTASPTSTACSRRGPSARRSTASPAPTTRPSSPPTRTLHGRLLETERVLAEVASSARERAREADLLRFGLGEIDAVSPQPGEDAELAAEESRLGFADTLRTAAEQAREALSSDDDQPDALAAAAAARGLLDGVRDHDPEAGALADRLAELTYVLSDLASDVASYSSGLETDPARLAAVSERRAALTALTRKYGSTVDEVLAWAEESAARLLDLDGTDDRIADPDGRAGRAAPTARRGRHRAVAEPPAGRGGARRRGHRRAGPAGDAGRAAGDRGAPARRRAARRRPSAADAAGRGPAAGRHAVGALRRLRHRRGRVPARGQRRRRAAPARPRAPPAASCRG